MSEKRRDSKGRVLRNGESQRSDGKYMFRYTDGTGERHTVYSWKLVSTEYLSAVRECCNGQYHPCEPCVKCVPQFPQARRIEPCVQGAIDGRAARNFY